MTLQPIYNIPAICYEHGVRHIVLSPGSRSAPLALAFARYPGFEIKIIPDERSAAFIGMGIAQQTVRPVVLICTSGSAAANFYPAIIESFYQQIPLLVLTADRPAEWIDQGGGQSIRQQNLYATHVKKSYQLPDDLSHPDAQWFVNRAVNEALLLSREYPASPVHINIPIREPFYPQPGEAAAAKLPVRCIYASPSDFHLSSETVSALRREIQSYSKILVLIGQGQHHEVLSALKVFCEKFHAIAYGDILSNTHGFPLAVQHADIFLPRVDDTAVLVPDLLITFGLTHLSKPLKGFLRKTKLKAHWHIQPSGIVADTFAQLTKIVRTTPQVFLEQCSELTPTPSLSKQEYERSWQQCKILAQEHLSAFQKEMHFDEFHIVQSLLQRLPALCHLHLANSMSVRYANWFGLPPEKSSIRVYSNRGCSGIDGSVSAAVGHALAEQSAPHLLITGDMSFLYDKNALWHSYRQLRLNIVVLNNRGGIIFDLIDGPSALPEKKQYFVTEQPQIIESIAYASQLQYLRGTAENFEDALQACVSWDNTLKIIEFDVDAAATKAAYQRLFGK